MASTTFTLDGTNAALETDFGVNSTGSVKVVHDGVNITAVPGAYTVAGIENGSTTITVTLSEDYNTSGSTVVISRVDYVDPSSPASSLLYDVGKLPGGGVNPVQLRAELVHLLQLIGDINGDTSGATVPLDNVSLTDRINAIAAIIVNTPTEDGDGNWTGADDPGDTVEDIEGRVDTLETGLAAEITNRAADVDAEEAAREAADGVEAAARAAADAALTAALASAVATLQAQISTGVGLPAGSSSDEDYDSMTAEPVSNYILGYSEAGAVQVQDINRLIAQRMQGQGRTAVVSAMRGSTEITHGGSSGDWGFVFYVPRVTLSATQFNGGVFILLTETGTGDLLLSYDADTWHAGTWPAVSALENPKAGVYAPSLGLVIVGCGYKAATTENIATAAVSDLTTWTERDLGSAIGVTAIAWSEDQTLAVATGDGSAGSTDQFFTSPNGTAWTARTAPITRTWRDVCFAPEIGTWVAVANTASQTQNIVYSTNGMSWTACTAHASGLMFESVAWSPLLGLFVAVGSPSSSVLPLAAYSADGVTWTAYSAYTVVSGSPAFSSVIWVDDWRCFVAALSTSAHAAVSFDGKRWIEVKLPATITPGKMAYSPDANRLVIPDNATGTTLLASA